MVVHCPSSGQFFNIIARAGLGSRAGSLGRSFVPVTPAVESMVAVTYVRDIE